MKILVLDSDPQAQQAVAAALSGTGMDTVLSVYPREALEKLDQDGSIELVIADLTVPGQEGFDVLRHMKANPKTARIPLIVCSELSDPAVVMRAIELGARDYLVKPIHPETLLGKVNRSLEGRDGPVLLVDDDNIVLELLKRVVSREGYRTLTCSTAEEAILVAKSNKLFAVVSDIGLPGMNGLDLLVQLKEHDATLPVLLVTGNTGRFSREDVIAAGADGFITKPFKNIEITRKLLHFRGRPRRATAKPAQVHLS